MTAVPPVELGPPAVPPAVALLAPSSPHAVGLGLGAAARLLAATRRQP
jgi:hypothetical protein